MSRNKAQKGLFQEDNGKKEIEIENIFFDVPDTFIPESLIKKRDSVKSCDVCKNEMTAVITFNHQMKTTRLSSNVCKFIIQDNKNIQNPLGRSCHVCGATICTDCHCHRYDCETCEPDNFCKNCNGILVYESVKSM